MALDPIEAMVTDLQKASTEQFAFYRDHLEGLVSVYKKNKGKYDKHQLLQMMVKSLVESDNSREDLCYQVVTAVHLLSER